MGVSYKTVTFKCGHRHTVKIDEPWPKSCAACAYQRYPPPCPVTTHRQFLESLLDRMRGGLEQRGFAPWQANRIAAITRDAWRMR